VEAVNSMPLPHTPHGWASTYYLMIGGGTLYAGDRERVSMTLVPVENAFRPSAISPIDL
jgi:hypothetical protein